MTIHQSTVPEAVASYFGCGRHPAIEDHPIIEQTFIQGRGWKNLNYRKRISLSECRKLRAAGVEFVALRWHGRLADFPIKRCVK